MLHAIWGLDPSHRSHLQNGLDALLMDFTCSSHFEHSSNIAGVDPQKPHPKRFLDTRATRAIRAPRAMTTLHCLGAGAGTTSIYEGEPSSSWALRRGRGGGRVTGGVHCSNRVTYEKEGFLRRMQQILSQRSIRAELTKPACFLGACERLPALRLAIGGVIRRNCM